MPGAALNDRYRRLYLETILGLLEGPRRQELLARAQGLVVRWRSIEHMSPYYADRWLELLAMPGEKLRTVIMADSDEADRMRHCMPFAGMLSNGQRAALRNIARAAVD